MRRARKQYQGVDLKMAFLFFVYPKDFTFDSVTLTCTVAATSWFSLGYACALLCYFGEMSSIDLCAICLDPMDAEGHDDVVTGFWECCHELHKDCFANLVLSGTGDRCPICRARFLAPTTEYAFKCGHRSTLCS